MDNDIVIYLRSRIKIASNGCWLWLGHISQHGYGKTTIKGRAYLAHRLTYQTFVGPIPDEMTLDHLCRVRHCVNPNHLEPVSMAENIRRGRQGQWQRAKTHCPKGHEYTSENTYIYRGLRGCRQCRRQQTKAWRARVKDSA